MSITPTTHQTSNFKESPLELMQKNTRAELADALKDPNSSDSRIFMLVLAIFDLSSRISSRRQREEHEKLEPQRIKEHQRKVALQKSKSQLFLTGLGTVAQVAVGIDQNSKTLADGIGMGTRCVAEYWGQSTQGQIAVHQFSIDQINSWQGNSRDARQHYQSEATKTHDLFQQHMQSEHRTFSVMAGG